MCSSDLAGPWSSVVSGRYVSCGLDGSGVAACWGEGVGMWTASAARDGLDLRTWTEFRGGLSFCGKDGTGWGCWSDTATRTYDGMLDVFPGSDGICTLDTGNASCDIEPDTDGWRETNDAPAGLYSTLSVGSAYSCGLSEDATQITCWANYGETSGE